MVDEVSSKPEPEYLQKLVPGINKNEYYIIIKMRNICFVYWDELFLDAPENDTVLLPH